MSTVSLVIIGLGIAATLLFLAGFVRGAHQAVANRDAAPDSVPATDTTHFWSATFAVIASAVVIAAVGFFPEAIYIGPFLAILTAAAVGVAFFVDRGN